MKQLPNRDIIIALLLSIISILCIFISPLNEFPVRLIPAALLLFILPGYALITALNPFQEKFTPNSLITSIIASVLITLFLSIIALAVFKIPNDSFFLILVVLTILMLLIAYFRRRDKSEGYLICENCRGYYKLEKGESAEDFKQCQCGGNLKYVEYDKIKLNDTDSFSKRVSLVVFSIIPRINGKDSKGDPKVTKNSKSGKFLPWDLLLVFMATILCLIFVTVPYLSETSIRIILGLIFILFLPGYSLIAALFPKKDDLDGIERLALSFGLSIAITPLIGLILNYTPFGIRLTPILISLSLFTILMCIIAFFRRLKTPEEERLTYGFRYHLNSLITGFTRESKLDRILSVLLVLSIVIAISATIYVIVTPKEGEKFTEFYILGPNGKASDYPTNLTVGQNGTVKIGIINHEYAKTNYKLVVKLNNTTLKEENITLNNNAKWENQFTFTATRTGQKQKMEFLLYKIPDNKVYRSLHLWINVQ